MTIPKPPTDHLSRRRFLSQSFAFSALAAAAPASLFAAPAAGAAHALMVGDWGAEKPAAQARVASSMQAYAVQNSIKANALFMLGDNWYGPLPGGVHDKRWTAQFEDMYPKSAFNCPAYAIPGNHDYQRMPASKVASELEYARTGGPSAKSRWTMPALWYSFKFPQKHPLATVIALDSNMPGPKDDGVNFTLTDDQRAQQLAWLTAELAKPLTTPFRIVMGHHPVFSNGPHGDTHILVEDWEPLLRKHNIHLYLAGHDHDMQHLEFEGHPTSFALSGGGGSDLYELKIQPAERGPYAARVYGFTDLELTRDTLTIRHIDDSGHLLHAFAKTKEGKVTILS